MDARARTPPGPSYDDFEPRTKRVSEEGANIFVVYVPEFKKEHLRVQLTTSRRLEISGQRPIGKNKWERFLKEVRVPENCDISQISAKLQHGILYIRQPRLNPLENEEKPTTEARGPQHSIATKPPLQTTPSLPHRDRKAYGPTEAEKKAEEENEAGENFHDASAMAPNNGEGEKEHKSKEKRGEEEKSRKREVDARIVQAVGLQKVIVSREASRSRKSNGHFFHEMKKPGNMKKVITIVVSGVVMGLFITSMLKWYAHENQEPRVETCSGE